MKIMKRNGSEAAFDREKIAAGTLELLRQCQALGETLAFLKEPE